MLEIKNETNNRIGDGGWKKSSTRKYLISGGSSVLMTNSSIQFTTTLKPVLDCYCKSKWLSSKVINV